MKLLRLLPVLLALSGAAWGQRVDNPPGVSVGGPVSTNTVTAGGLSETLATWLAGISGQSYCAFYSSLQACHDALPSTGGQMFAAPNTTYVQTATLMISKPNVTLQCPSWATIIQRGANSTVMPNQVVNLTGAGDQIKDCTIDGNGGTYTGAGADLSLSATNQLAWHNQVLNTGGSIALAMGAAGDRASSNTITALASATVGGYGIWAISHVQVQIDDNVVSGTNADGIGFDGTGSTVTGNHLFNDHCYAGGGGGQIVIYPQSYASVVANNTIDEGCGALSFGIEVNGVFNTIVDNTIEAQRWGGITIDPSSGPGILIAGNSVRNSGQTTGGTSSSGLTVNIMTGLTVAANRFVDDQGTHTQAYGIYLAAGATNNLTVVGNDLVGNLTSPLFNGATGSAQTLSANLGVTNTGFGNIAPDQLVSIGQAAGPSGAMALWGSQANSGTEGTLLFESAVSSGNTKTIIGQIQGYQSNVSNRLDFYTGAWDNNNSPGSVLMSLLSNGNLGIGTTAPAAKLEVNGTLQVDSATAYSGTAPVVSACGTSPSIDSHATNSSGTVTVGTVAAASCTVTFANSGFVTWNHCRVTPQTALATFGYSYTKTVLTVTATSLLTEVFDYQCDGS